MIKVNILRQNPEKGETAHIESFNVQEKDKMKSWMH